MKNPGMQISRRTLLLGSAAATIAARSGIALAAADPGVTVPIHLLGNRVAVDISVANGRSFEFMLDTGAYCSLIRQDVAKSLRLETAGTTVFNGRRLPLYVMHDVLIGNTFRERSVAVAGFEGEGLGRDIAGTLSSAVLTDTDSDLDFAKGEWRLFPNGRGDPPSGFVELGSTIARSATGIGSAYIFVDGVLDGTRYRFVVDTGMPGSLKLYNEAARRSGLADGADRRFAPVHTANTNGGGKVSAMVRAASLDLGNGIRFERPFVVLDQNATWHFPGADGIIGLALLRQLNLATDTRRGRLLVKRNGVQAPVEAYPRSGLWIDKAGRALSVTIVGTGSPAAAAGIQPKDLILGMDFDAALHALGQPAGTAVPLTIERAGVRRDVVLTLADYL